MSVYKDIELSRRGRGDAELITTDTTLFKLQTGRIKIVYKVRNVDIL